MMASQLPTVVSNILEALASPDKATRTKALMRLVQTEESVSKEITDEERSVLESRILAALLCIDLSLVKLAAQLINFCSGAVILPLASSCTRIAPEPVVLARRQALVLLAARHPDAVVEALRLGSGQVQIVLLQLASQVGIAGALGAVLSWTNLDDILKRDARLFENVQQLCFSEHEHEVLTQVSNRFPRFEGLVKVLIDGADPRPAVDLAGWFDRNGLDAVGLEERLWFEVGFDEVVYAIEQETSPHTLRHWGRLISHPAQRIAILNRLLQIAPSEVLEISQNDALWGCPQMATQARLLLTTEHLINLIKQGGPSGTIAVATLVRGLPAVYLDELSLCEQCQVEAVRKAAKAERVHRFRRMLLRVPDRELACVRTTDDIEAALWQQEKDTRLENRAPKWTDSTQDLVANATRALYREGNVQNHNRYGPIPDTFWSVIPETRQGKTSTVKNLKKALHGLESKTRCHLLNFLEPLLAASQLMIWELTTTNGEDGYAWDQTVEVWYSIMECTTRNGFSLVYTDAYSGPL